jgi:hypothetical protein
MKRKIEGYVVIAVVCLLTARLGAEETVFNAADTGPTLEKQLFEGQRIERVIGAPAERNKNGRLTETFLTEASTAPSWSLIGINSFEFHADFLRHNYDLIKTRQLLESLSFYYGLGGRMKLQKTNTRKQDRDDDAARLGMRSPLGISYAFQEKPVELFAEVVPILDILPETRLGVGVGVGARYYFSLL